MKECVFSFENTSGDQYVLSLAQDGDKFLSEEVSKILHERNIEVWGIILFRTGNKEHVTSIKLLSQIAKSISLFVLEHPNAILYYQCDDMEEVPMNESKRKSGLSVQHYRSLLFTKMFEKQASLFSLPVFNIPIYFDFMGNETYIHIIARECHLNEVKIIQDDIHGGFDK